MSILTIPTTGNAQVQVKKTSRSTHAALNPIGESVMEIKSSKTREERRTVDAGRRSSSQHDNAECYKERRGSRDAMRRKSSAATAADGHLGEFKRRHGSVSGKRDVWVTTG